MDELYTLYRPCFPDYPAAEAVFRECLKRERGQVLYAGEGGETVGYALIHGGSLSLLCVRIVLCQQIEVGSRTLHIPEINLPSIVNGFLLVV